jgi:N-carbamoylputrescine amidase
MTKITEKQIMRLALIQQANTADTAQNLERTIRSIRMAAADGAQVILLQELFNTLYFCTGYDESAFVHAESNDSPLLKRMQQLAAELELVIVVPYFEKRAQGVYHNSAVIFDADGQEAAFYRKMHIPDDPGFCEKYYFTPGDLGYKVADTRYGKIGILICWDQWFPEAARITAMMGADLLVYPTAIGVLATETEAQKTEFREAWEMIQRSHAIANGCYVAAINRVGTESGTTFWGDSFVVGPFGQWVARAGENEEILHAKIDLSSIDEHRRTWPFFRDRRIDSYKGITERLL